MMKIGIGSLKGWKFLRRIPHPQNDLGGVGMNLAPGKKMRKKAKLVIEKVGLTGFGFAIAIGVILNAMMYNKRREGKNGINT